MDYRELLAKYIHYIIDVEGYDPSIYQDLGLSSVNFTDSEWRTIQNLSKER